MWRFLLLLLAGCATQERGDCLDWKIYEVPLEKCTPLYGTFICQTQILHHYHCILREDNGNTEKRESES